MSYLDTYAERIELRGLQPHTMKSYQTYLRAYLEYADQNLHKKPEFVTWDELSGFVRYLQAKRNLSDSTINAVISQLRFFTIFVLHKP